MDTLDLVRADDDVLEGTAVLDDEDGVRVAALFLTRARDSTAVGLHATVKGLAVDLVDLVEGDAALRVGDREGVALRELAGGGLGVGAGAMRGQHAGRQGEKQAVLDEHGDRCRSSDRV